MRVKSTVFDSHRWYGAALILAIWFLIWCGCLVMSVRQLQSQVAVNVGLLRDLGKLGSGLRRMEHLANTPLWEAEASSCRGLLAAMDRGSDAGREVQPYLDRIGGVMAEMRRTQPQLHPAAERAQEMRGLESLFHAQANTGIEAAEDAAAVVRRRQAAVSRALAVRWFQMEWLVLVSCMLTVVLALVVRARQKLARSEAQFRLLFEEAPVAYHEFNQDGVLQLVNHAECEQLGYSREELIGRHVWELLSPESRAEGEAQIRRRLREQEPAAPAERSFVRKDGSVLIAQVYPRIIRDQEGGAIGFRATCIDISERKRAERALQESVSLLNATLDASTDGILVVNLHGRVVSYSRRLLELWRLPEGSLPVLGERRLVDLVADQLVDPDRLRQEVAAVYAEPERETFGELEFKDGRVFERWSRPQRIGEQVIGVVWTFRDVTERRSAEVALRRAKEEAEAASVAKGAFLANMSHEIRTPMAGVLGMIDLVLASELTPTQREHLSVASSSADSLLTLLNDILDLSKIEAGRLEIVPNTFSVRAAMGEALQLFAVRAQEKGLALTLHIDPQVPDLLVGDTLRLRQILVNLLGNAVKFTDQGGISVNVGGVGTDGGRMLRIEVADTGTGIPADKHQIIFDPFRQVDSSNTRRHMGTGLGLTISARLARLMGGSIGVFSTPGKGSTFFFTVPLIPSANKTAPDRLPRVAPRPVAAAAAQRPLRILVAEDNAVNQKLVTLVLKREGHEVVMVDDGQKAVDAVRESHYDLVLMDIQMPVKDGYEATAAIREGEKQTSRHLPIVAMTAHAMRGEMEKSIAAGMDDYLTKPIVMAELRRVLAKVADIVGTTGAGTL